MELVQEYDRLCVEGCVVHSEQYKPGLKRDSTAVKVGDCYAKVEHTVNVLKFDGSSEVFIVSHVYAVENLGHVCHMKRAHKSVLKRLHHVTICSPMYISEPKWLTDISGAVQSLWIIVKECTFYRNQCKIFVSCSSYGVADKHFIFS